MMIKFLAHGTGSAAKAADYLTRQEKQFRRVPVTSMEKPAGLGDDHRGLAAAGCGDHQVAVLVDDDRPALLVGKRPRLNAVARDMNELMR